jgi:hypothetical protein
LTTTTIDYASLANDIGLDFDVAGENLYSSSRTLSLAVGQPVSFQAEIGEHTVEAGAELVAGKLTRLSVLENEYRDGGGSYLQVTGVLNDVDLNVWLYSEGERVPLGEFLCGIYNTKAPSDQKLDPTEFMARMNNLGFRFNGGSTIMWQHFGVDPNELATMIETLKGFGMVDVIDSIPVERRGRIRQAYEFPKGNGLEISSIEVTKSDRSQSWTGQGFRNFPEAAIDSMTRTLRLRQLARFHANAADNAETPVEASQHRAIAAHLLSESNSWSSNLGGVQQRKRLNDGNEVIEVGVDGAPSNVKIDPVSVPIGRIGYRHNDTEGVLELWKRNDTEPALPNATAQVAPSAPDESTSKESSEEDDTEEPF